MAHSPTANAVIAPRTRGPAATLAAPPVRSSTAELPTIIGIDNRKDFSAHSSFPNPARRIALTVVPLLEIPFMHAAPWHSPQNKALKTSPLLSFGGESGFTVSGSSKTNPVIAKQNGSHSVCEGKKYLITPARTAVGTLATNMKRLSACNGRLNREKIFFRNATVTARSVAR